VLDTYCISVIPQKIVWNGVIYRDGLDLFSADFYNILPTSQQLPITMPPSPAEIAHMFEQARVSTGADRVVALFLSSRLSETFVNAQAAARELDFPVFVHDSQTVSLALGFSAIAAAEARR
jgi:DegV family protein with EDD domain